MPFLLILVSIVAGYIAALVCQDWLGEKSNNYLGVAIPIGIALAVYAQLDYGWAILYSVASMLGYSLFAKLNTGTRQGKHPVITKTQIRRVKTQVIYTSKFLLIAAPVKYEKTNEGTALLATLSAMVISFVLSIAWIGIPFKVGPVYLVAVFVLLYFFINLMFKLLFRGWEWLKYRYENLPEGDEKPKHKPEYIRFSDGELSEVVEDEPIAVVKRKRNG